MIRASAVRFAGCPETGVQLVRLEPAFVRTLVVFSQRVGPLRSPQKAFLQLPVDGADGAVRACTMPPYFTFPLRKAVVASLAHTVYCSLLWSKFRESSASTDDVSVVLAKTSSSKTCSSKTRSTHRVFDDISQPRQHPLATDHSVIDVVFVHLIVQTLSWGVLATVSDPPPSSLRVQRNVVFAGFRAVLSENLASLRPSTALIST